MKTAPYVDKSDNWTAFDVSVRGAVAPFKGDVPVSVEAVLADSGQVTGWSCEPAEAASSA